MQMGGSNIIAVARNPDHKFSKAPTQSIALITGEGIFGDAHCGVTVKHRSRVAADPTQPNLRQVHLIHSELFDDLSMQGFFIKPGDIGENITTMGIDLLKLPQGALLHIGGAIISITGLRNPCRQLNNFAPGLMNALLDKAADGSLILKAGVMGVVVKGGTISVGDAIEIELPQPPFVRLERV